MSSTDVAVEIGELAGLDLYALRERWLAFYTSAAPNSMSRELMIRAIAYRIQEERFGGLSPATRVRLLATPAAGRKPPPVRKSRVMKPGTKFLREWYGRTHEVVATADGQFLYRGCLSLAERHRQTDHRHPLVGSGLLRSQHWHEDQRCDALGRTPPPHPRMMVAADCAAPSIHGRAARKAWSRVSTLSTPSGMPARPTSPARSTKAGRSCPQPTTMVVFRAARCSAPPFKRYSMTSREGRSTL